MEKFIINLEDIRFYSSIGVMDQERLVGNEFVIDLSIEIDASEFESENLDSSVSYADLYEVLESEMKKPVLLLETVTKRIGDRICSKWNQIQRLSIKITKLAPPISGISGESSVTYLKTRD